MPTWMIIILIVALLVLWVLFSNRRRSVAKKNAASRERLCKQCQEPVPDNYTKSLCPHCNGFLM
jgi:hypothetical protein